MGFFDDITDVGGSIADTVGLGGAYRSVTKPFARVLDRTGNAIISVGNRTVNAAERTLDSGLGLVDNIGKFLPYIVIGGVVIAAVVIIKKK